jgi:hypothetical protein
MEDISTSETSVNFYEIIGRNIPEDNRLAVLKILSIVAM